MAAKYDIIGLNYAQLRKPDPSIAAAIQQALGRAETVLNVGAGTGSYEPVDRRVTAVEPSIEMIRKRSPSTAKVVQASAEHLPFDDDAFDAASSSSFWAMGSSAESGLKRLKQDLETGEWERRYAELLRLDAYDAGYRIVVAESG